jgi:hypothetical protein
MGGVRYTINYRAREEIREKLNQYFPGRPVTFELELPQEIGDTRHTWALVHVTGEAQDELARLSEFDREYWLDAYSRFKGKVNVNLCFDPIEETK